MVYTPATVTQVAQWGEEADAGKAVEATNLFRSVEVTMTPKYETEAVRPAGSRFASTTYLKKVSTEIKAEGLADWNEMPSLLRWACGVGTKVGDNEVYTIGRGMTRTLVSGDLNTGDAAEVTNCFVTDFGFTWGKNSGDAKFTLSGMGSYWNEAATLAEATVSREVLPMDASQVNVYVDATKDTLGKTQLTDALSVEFSSGTMRNAVWTLDRDFGSYSDRVDTALGDGKVTLKIKNTEQGRQFVAALRSGATKYVRVHVSNGNDKTAEFDFAVKTSTYTVADDSDVWASTVECLIVEDDAHFSHQFSIAAPK